MQKERFDIGFIGVETFDQPQPARVKESLTAGNGKIGVLGIYMLPEQRDGDDMLFGRLSVDDPPHAKPFLEFRFLGIGHPFLVVRNEIIREKWKCLSPGHGRQERVVVKNRSRSGSEADHPMGGFGFAGLKGGFPLPLAAESVPLTGFVHDRTNQRLQVKCIALGT